MDEGGRIGCCRRGDETPADGKRRGEPRGQAVSHADRADRRLRVVMLIDTLVAGGAEDFATQLAVHLDPARFRRTLCVSRWTPDALQRQGAEIEFGQLRDAGVEFLGLERPLGPAQDLSLRRRLSLGAWGPLVRRLRAGEVDVLHAHKFGSNVWAALLGLIARPPVAIAHEQTWSYEGQPLRRFLDRELIARRADAFICVSNLDRKRMIEIERIDPAKIVLVPNAIPTPPPASGPDLRAELGIAEGTPVIGTVCRLSEQKRLDVLLEAINLLRRKFPEARLLIAGDGPERDALEALIANLGLDEIVTLLGRRTDLPELLAAFDVAVSSSDYEGTPLALMDCMAADLPIVATRVGGVPELIEDGVQGRLVERRDPRALAEALGELLANPERAATMGRNAGLRRREQFDLAVAAERVGDLYERLYASSRRADPARVKG